MNNKPIKILYLEDSQEDIDLMKRTLAKSEINYELKISDSKASFIAALDMGKPDLILADHTLFQFNSLEALKIFKSYEYSIPFILVTGTVSEEYAVKVLKEGADDYILKDRLARLPMAIDQALEKKRLESAKKETEARLDKARETAEFLLKNVDGILWESDSDSLNYNYLSPQVINILGYAPEEWQSIPHFWEEHLHPEDKDITLDAFKSNLQKISDFTLNYRFRHKSGKFVWIQDRIKIHATKGGPNRITGIMIDISVEKELNESLIELNLRLEKSIREMEISNQELEQFAYVVSHDLQEPLRMVSNFMTQLENKYGDVLDEKARQYIHFATDGAKRMRQIILDLLDYSRVGRHLDSLTEIDVQEIVGQAVSLNRKLIEDSDAKIVYSDLPIILSYKIPFTQIILNLLGNALKYQKENIPPLIEIKSVREEGFWVFSVSDNGIGIQEDMFEQIFVIFQRLHNQSHYRGTGIGLSIVKKIVEGLGGKVWLSSKVGEGSTFYFKLPILHA
jgi:PAS domain S-box-containing protein